MTTVRLARVDGGVAGGRVEKVAEGRGMALSTVRTQLLQVFAKTGTSRQGELVGLVGRCVGQAQPRLVIHREACRSTKRLM